MSTLFPKTPFVIGIIVGVILLVIGISMTALFVWNVDYPTGNTGMTEEEIIELFQKTDDYQYSLLMTNLITGLGMAIIVLTIIICVIIYLIRKGKSKL